MLAFFLSVSWSQGFGQDSADVQQQDRRSDIEAAPRRFTHHIGLEFRPAFVIPTSPFFKGVNSRQTAISHSYSAHLRYAFSLPAGILGSRVFPGTQQGVGLAYYDFGNHGELGSPVVAYLFQHSPVAKLNSRLSLHYEWNVGLSAGWEPYNKETNPNNIVMGSKVNAYVNFGLYFSWRPANRWVVTGGVDVTHFSNGNTKYPNAGLNTSGLKLGILYDLSKPGQFTQKIQDPVPAFPRHISYDCVLFGAWRRKGVDFAGKLIASPYQYPVAGAYFAPMYNLGYKFRTGLSVDAIYDGSANVYTNDYYIEGTERQFFRPHWNRQVALGVSLRAEYVMPVFTVGLGVGGNVIHKGGDLSGSYQSFTLKIHTSRSSFIHIGYCLRNFYDPNYLMIGLGYRFNNRAPLLFSM